MQKIRWGILGCGKIARKFADDLKHVADGELVAIGARSRESADLFAATYPVKKVHYDYASLAKDPGVDIIYIATPHGLHHEHTLLCLEHKKAVLCEKAFALNSREAREMVEKARAEGCFLMEALWSKFLPHYQLLKQYLNEGKIGTVKSVLINFGFAPTGILADRIYENKLGGGALLDIGIYTVFFAMAALGKPDSLSAVMTPASTGVDEQCAITFRYKDGALAQLFCTFSSNLATEADFNGTKGRIRLTSRFYEPSTTFEYYTDRVDSRQVIPFTREDGWGYQYEIRHVQECLRQGLIESPVMRHEDTLQLMEVLDAIREQAGIVYTADT